MFWSRNNFFDRSKKDLEKARILAIQLLKIKGRTREEIVKYMIAYDYFILNPTQYDGATIVKDLVDVRYKGRYLDLDAMLHDYDYLHGANSNFIKKWKADLSYIKNMEFNGKGIRVFRFTILTTIGVALVPYKYIKQINK